MGDLEDMDVFGSVIANGVRFLVGGNNMMLGQKI